MRIHHLRLKFEITENIPKMKVVHYYTYCESSLNVRNPSTISEGLLNRAPLHLSLWNCSKEARSKVCNTLLVYPPISPEKSMCTIANF
uniref:Uncharacterized protein n=1 Tax=Arundo donax TaxID=35708 RepID=A0A0A9GWG2_ARUDO